MLSRLREAHKSGDIIDLRYVFSAYAIDVITEYAFGKGGSMNFMADPNYGKYWSDLTVTTIPINNFSRQFPLLMRVMMVCPEWVMVMMNSNLSGYTEWMGRIVRRIRDVLEDDTMTGKAGRREDVTLFHELKHSDLPEGEKGLRRLTDEANMVVGAGGETTAQTLTRMYFHLLTSPEVLGRLRKELIEALPDGREMPTLGFLQQLPYLNAVVEEGVRISFPVPARSPRVFRDHTLRFEGYEIRPGVSGYRIVRVIDVVLTLSRQRCPAHPGP